MFYSIYNTILRLLQPIYFLGARLHPGLKEFKASRLAGRERLLRFIEETGGENVVWLHAASVGELDQALALAREIRARQKTPKAGKAGRSRPPLRIIASVFSLSVRKSELPEFDLIFYLPVDLPAHWEEILNRFRPLFFATMTWDAWPNLLRALAGRGIPAYLCSAALSADSPRLRGWRAALMRPVYEHFSGIGTVDEENRERFLKLLPDPDRVKATGDTRFDTILYKIANTKLDPATRKTFERIKNSRPLWILASTYSADDRQIFPHMSELLERFPDWRVLIFPHHIDEDRLHEVEEGARSAGVDIARYSALARENENKNTKRNTANETPRCILVDRMGILALAYRFGDFCYVGGGYHHRIHNTAEPAVLGLPIITGPRIDTSPIALDLEAVEALRRTRSGDEIATTAAGYMDDARTRKAVGKTATKVVKDQAGAARMFYNTFLTNRMG